MNKSTITIIGGGLSGLTAASYLSKYADVTILEQGKEYEDRTIQNSDEVLIGLGGAGTLSGGKLCFPPASGGIWRKTRSHMPKFQDFCYELYGSLNSLLTISGEAEDIPNSAMSKKVYHTELILQDSMQRYIRDHIIQLQNQGCTIRSHCRANRILHSDERYEIIFDNESREVEHIVSSYVIIATGRTSVPFLHNLFALDSHHQPDLGIRLSLDTNQPAFSRVGADIKIKQQMKNYLVRTFCVCCGGGPIKTATRGLVHYDGHFTDKITDITNLGLLARSPNYSGKKAVEYYLQSMQPYVDKDISLRDFIRYYSIIAKGSPYEELFEVLASFALELYRNALLVQNADEIPVMFPSVDNINPLIWTDSSFESYLHNVFVIGDAAGVSRGFVQSMWAGFCAAERIVEKITCSETILKSIQTA